MLFLGKLFNKAIRKSASNKNSEFNSPAAQLDSESPENTIPEQYLPLLELRQQRQLLEVKITGSSKIYQSMILAIDCERGLLWLDDLFPQQFVVDAGDEITIRHHRNGEQLLIRAPIVAMGSTYEASGFAISLPEFIFYSPRRNSQRFTIGHQSPISVKFRTLGQEPSFGTLQDISTGGLRLLVAGNMLAHLRHGALLPLCEVAINSDLQIRCRARICAFRMGRSPYRHTQISMEFVDLEEETRTLLARFLHETQFSNTNHKHSDSHQHLHSYAA
jgi:c-di-GMP-binding flagellar brake protein YcgR